MRRLLERIQIRYANRPWQLNVTENIYTYSIPRTLQREPHTEARENRDTEPGQADLGQALQIPQPRDKCGKGMLGNQHRLEGLDEVHPSYD